MARFRYRKTNKQSYQHQGFFKKYKKTRIMTVWSVSLECVKTLLGQGITPCTIKQESI
jgi:hypothetical protein